LSFDGCNQQTVTTVEVNQQMSILTIDPISDLTSLRVDLPCHVADPELWFAETPQGVEDAKARCRQCPLQAVCLEGALERREPWGVWGGELFELGKVVPRKRPRGRPRKVAA
jgi:WhiB family redox-sensing transcriptional regulator